MEVPGKPYAHLEMEQVSEQQDNNPTDITSLQEELDHFRAEKEKIREIIGHIGGENSNWRDRIINILFAILILVLLTVDILRHLFGGLDWLPSLFSLEIGVLLVSIKIIWMIHKQAKVEHFQFWILNSIEFRLNEIAKRLANVEKASKD